MGWGRLWGGNIVMSLVGGYRRAISWCDLDLTFDLEILTLSSKIFSVLYLGKCKV